MQTQAMMGPRAVPIFMLALAVALGLFSLMYTVIHVGGHGIDKAETLQTIDFVRLRRDSQVESMERRKPPPHKTAKSAASLLPVRDISLWHASNNARSSPIESALPAGSVSPFTVLRSIAL